MVWYAGSLLLRAAAFGWYVLAGVGLLLAGQGDHSPWAPVAFAGLGAECWAAGHVLHRARRGWWAAPLAARVFSGRLPRRQPTSPIGVNGDKHSLGVGSRADDGWTP